jgi:Amt family ammonium transporter
VLIPREITGIRRNASTELSGAGFTAFLAHLNASGYTIDPSQIAAAYQLVFLATTEQWQGVEHRVANLLAPIFARTPGEQDDIHRRVEAWSGVLFPERKRNLTATREVSETPRLAVGRDRDIERLPDSPGGTLTSITLGFRRTAAMIFVVVLAAAVLLGVGATFVFAPKTAQPPPPTESPGGTQSPSPTDVLSKQDRRVAQTTVTDWTVAIPIVLGLLPPAFALCWFFLADMRRRAFILCASASPRDLAEIRVLAPDTPVFEGFETAMAVRDLLQRVLIPVEEPNIERSVDATVRAAGLATLVRREKPFPSEYVVLIEDAGEHDHLRRLSEMALDRLSAAGLITKHYRVAHPNLAYDSSGRFVSLDTIAATGADDRLLILGPGEAIVDPSSGRLPHAIGPDARWSQKGLLVVGAIDDTTARELRNVGFALAPATPVGMRRLAYHFTELRGNSGAILAPLAGTALGSVGRLSSPIARADLPKAPAEARIDPSSIASRSVSGRMDSGRAVLKAVIVSVLAVAIAALIAISAISTSTRTGPAGEVLACTVKVLENCAPNAGDTAWMLGSAILVWMAALPGLVLFCCGLAPSKDLGRTIIRVFASVWVIVVLWVIINYSVAFRAANPFLGGLDRLTLQSILSDIETGTGNPNPLAPTIPETVFIVFQMSVAMMPPILIASVLAERMKLSAMLWFIGLWVTLVYSPTTHWVWGPDGFLSSSNTAAWATVLDFAGGTVVQLNSGIAGLLACVVLGTRDEVRTRQRQDVILTVIGAALLWVGWFGLSAGQAFTAGLQAGMTMMVMQVATAAAGLTWMFVEWVVYGKPRALGICMGIFAGAVAITPASGFVGPGGALVIGIVSSLLCYWASTALKRLFGRDGALEVFGVQAAGGAIGALLTGMFAIQEYGGTAGWFEGNAGQVISQVEGTFIILLYNTSVSFIILKFVDFAFGLRESANYNEPLNAAV